MSDIVKVLRGKYALDYDEKTLDQFCNEAASEIEKLRVALQTARRDALEEAAQYHDKLAAAQQQMSETPVDELYTAIWKANAEKNRHYATAIRALGEKR